VDSDTIYHFVVQGAGAEQLNWRVKLNVNLEGDLNVAPGYIAIADAWLTRSSREYKENIEKIDGNEFVDSFMDLNFYYYEYKWDGRTRIGIISDEVPDYLAGENGGIDIYQYTTFTAITLQEFMQQTKERLDALEAQINSLKEVKKE
jgi:hypothetical protein